jgi:hypothetical protein
MNNDTRKRFKDSAFSTFKLLQGLLVVDTDEGIIIVCSGPRKDSSSDLRRSLVDVFKKSF